MRKLFRFKYEPCNGTCYAWCDVLPAELNKMSEQDRKTTIDLMVEAHSQLCDNPSYSFGVDREDSNMSFVAHFRTPESTDLFWGATFVDCVKTVCQKVLGANIPKTTGQCNYGETGSEDLGNQIIRACTDEAYRKAHHDACPCHGGGKSK